MISATATSPTRRDILKDELLNFNCYKFSRGIKAERPLSRRIVSAEECLCTRDTTEKICERGRLVSLHFREISGEEETRIKDRITDPDIPLDRIGVFRPDDKLNFINVPTEFLNVLWNAAVAADGVLRSVELTVQPQKGGAWAVYEVHLKEEIAEPFKLRTGIYYDRYKIGPPRPNPLVELRAISGNVKFATFVLAVIVAGWISRWIGEWISKLLH
jgi:hypothetical protein